MRKPRRISESQSGSCTPDERSAYVAVTRGREQAQIFTDDRKELVKVVCRPDDPMSATELAAAAPKKPRIGNRVIERLAFARRLALFASRDDFMPPNVTRDVTLDQELDHER